MSAKRIAFRLIFAALISLLVCGRAAAASQSEGAEKFMIAAAHPLAAEAGRDILARDGSAVDAAIATQMVLTLVEPQSSGIGGGAFLLYYDAAAARLETYDGRETAPAAVQPDHFLQADGEPKKFYDAVVGGGSVGAPGVLAMLEMAHRDHGRLPWAELFEPAIRHAREGFLITPRLHYLLHEDQYLKTRQPARAYFYDTSGEARKTGARLVNPELAETFSQIAKDGAQAFYRGDIAAAIVEAVRNDPVNPGLLSLDDLAAYRAIKRTPVCAPYRAYQVCGMGPPTSGGVTLLQMLQLLSAWDIPSLPPLGAEAIDLIAQASALAFADRGKYLADADFTDVPVADLLSPAYLARRARLIQPGAPALPFAAGDPREKQGSRGIDNAIELPSTSHFSIIDNYGNAVSMTTSVENAFGSRLMVRGFMLNNQLTDFSFIPATPEGPVANRIEPGKRPRSSMAPTMVFDSDGALEMVIGSPGGGRIIGYVLKTLVAALDWGVDIQTAIDMPHVINRNGVLEIEKETPPADLQPALEAMGYKVNVRALNSGLHGIHITQHGLVGGADRRREGVVLSE